MPCCGFTNEWLHETSCQLSRQPHGWLCPDWRGLQELAGLNIAHEVRHPGIFGMIQASTAAFWHVTGQIWLAIVTLQQCVYTLEQRQRHVA